METVMQATGTVVGEVRLCIYYPATLDIETTDAAIEKAAGKDSQGSGSDFQTRDMDFEYESIEDARAAKARILTVHPEITARITAEIEIEA